MSEYNVSGLGMMEGRIIALEQALRDVLNSIAVNLDDQEYSDQVIFAIAHAILNLDSPCDPKFRI